jgi:hypothetical protein
MTLGVAWDNVDAGLLHCEQREWIQCGWSSTCPRIAQNLFSSTLKRAVSVEFAVQEHLQKLKEQVVRCGNSKRDECWATWQIEIHGGIVEWDRQSGEPSVEQWLSDNPPRRAL